MGRSRIPFGYNPTVFFIVGFVAIGLLIAWRMFRRATDGPPRPPEPPPGTLYQEHLASPLPTDFPGELEIIVHPEALEFGWRSHLLDRARSTPLAATFGEGINWVSIPPQRIEHVEPRRLPLPQADLELLRPYVGLGLTAEWKFRVRGVSTGVAIREKYNRYWVATRHPDQLIAAIEAARSGKSGNVLPPPD